MQTLELFVADGVAWLEFIRIDTAGHRGANEVKIITVFGHAGIGSSGSVALEPVALGLFFYVCSRWKEYFRAGEEPFLDTCACLSQWPSAQAHVQRYYVDVKMIDHFRLNHGQDLHAVQNFGRAVQADSLLELIIGCCRNAGSPHGSQVDGDAIGLFEIEDFG